MGKQKRNKASSMLKLKDFHAKLIQGKLFPSCSNQRSVKLENNIKFLQNQYDALEDEFSEEDGEFEENYGTPVGHSIITDSQNPRIGLEEELPGARSEPLSMQSFEESFPHLIRLEAGCSSSHDVGKRGRARDNAIAKQGEDQCHAMAVRDEIKVGSSGRNEGLLVDRPSVVEEVKHGGLAGKVEVKPGSVPIPKKQRGEIKIQNLDSLGLGESVGLEGKSQTKGLVVNELSGKIKGAIWTGDGTGQVASSFVQTAQQVCLEGKGISAGVGPCTTARNFRQ